DLRSRRNGNHHARGGEVAFCYLRNTRRKHMVHPQAKGEKACTDQRHCKCKISESVAAAEGRDNGRDYGGSGYEDEIDLGMSKPPEEMLVYHHVSADSGIEKLSP